MKTKKNLQTIFKVSEIHFLDTFFKERTNLVGRIFVNKLTLLSTCTRNKNKTSITIVMYNKWADFGLILVQYDDYRALLIFIARRCAKTIKRKNTFFSFKTTRKDKKIYVKTVKKSKTTNDFCTTPTTTRYLSPLFCS